MKYIISIITAFIFYTTAQGQIGEFAYQISFPTGGFKDFVGKTSFVGFSGQFRHRLSNPQLSVGASLSWFYFSDKKGKITRPANEGTVTANITDFTNIYALMAVFQYDFKNPKERIVPFARIGAGIAYQDQRTDAGLYEWKYNGAQFSGNGEIGVRFNRDINHGILLAATYHILPAANDLVSTSFFGIKLGFTGW